MNTTTEAEELWALKEAWCQTDITRPVQTFALARMQAFGEGIGSEAGEKIILNRLFHLNKRHVVLSTWVRFEEREYLSTDRIPQRHVVVEIVEDSNCQMFSIWKVYFALFSQLGIVVGRDCEAEELADGVVGVVDLVVFGGEGMEEEGGERGGGDVGGV